MNNSSEAPLMTLECRCYWSGDSVLKDIDIRKITPTSATMHKLYVPGMTCEDLAAWLRKQPPRYRCKEVIFHVGVNSVHHGPVSEKSWFDFGEFVSAGIPPGLPASVQHPSVLQGQSLEDLAAWLRKQPPKVQMQEVIFHVE